MKFKKAKFVPIKDIEWKDLLAYSKYDMMQADLKNTLKRLKIKAPCTDKYCE